MCMCVYMHVVGAYALTEYDSDLGIAVGTAEGRRVELIQEWRQDGLTSRTTPDRAVRVRYLWDGGATVIHYPHHCRPALTLSNQMDIDSHIQQVKG